MRTLTNQQPANRSAAEISDADALDMLRLRLWQHQLNERLKRNEFKIPIHLAFGYEAAAVGMDRTMAPDDALCLTHRNVAYNLARSKSLDLVLAHYRNEERSECGAAMGSMNLATKSTRIEYASSILGNNLAVAAGIAMNRLISRKAGVVFTLVGDGGMEEGVFWETMVFARSHRLRLVIVVENNNHSMSSTIEQRRSPIDLAQVCAGVGFRYRRAFGASLADVRQALAAARGDADAGDPACVELELRAFNQHAGPTPGWPTDPMRITIDDGLILEESARDPIFGIKEAMGEAAFNRLASRVTDGTDG